MNLERYEFKANDNLTTFEFVSEGPKGPIVKLVQFTTSRINNVCNLAFGDKHGTTAEIDDKSISNNGDSERVLATVVTSIYAFTKEHPDTWIYAAGSTKSRTRLYRMGISKYLEEAANDFIICGLISDKWEPFIKGKDYEAFAVKRKFTKFEL